MNYFQKRKSNGRKFLKYATSVCFAVASFMFAITPVQAIDPVTILKTAEIVEEVVETVEVVEKAVEASSLVIGSTGGQLALSGAVKFFQTRPVLGIATFIVCGACIPVAGAPAAATAVAVACGLLLGEFLK